MVKTLLREWQAKVAAILFFAYSLWWIYLQLYKQSGDIAFDYFASTYCLMALWGGFWGLRTAHRWGGWKSLMGRAIYFFSFGLFAQAFGQLAYSYYVMVVGVEVPYPSIGDVGYFGSIPLYLVAIIHLAHASGVHLTLRSYESKLWAVAVPSALLIGTYALFLTEYAFDFSAPLTIFLDFGYPLGQSIYVAVALLTYVLSRTLLGGRMKKRVIFILLALFLQYVADFVFLYQAHTDQWLAAGINDFLYFAGYYIMTLSLLQLDTVWLELRTKQL